MQKYVQWQFHEHAGEIPSGEVLIEHAKFEFDVNTFEKFPTIGNDVHTTIIEIERNSRVTSQIIVTEGRGSRLTERKRINVPNWEASKLVTKILKWRAKANFSYQLGLKDWQVGFALKKPFLVSSWVKDAREIVSVGENVDNVIIFTSTLEVAPLSIIYDKEWSFLRDQKKKSFILFLKEHLKS